MDLNFIWGGRWVGGAHALGAPVIPSPMGKATGFQPTFTLNSHVLYERTYLPPYLFAHSLHPSVVMVLLYLLLFFLFCCSFQCCYGSAVFVVVIFVLLFFLLFRMYSMCMRSEDYGS